MERASPENRDRIQRYLALDEEELYALIPVYLPEYENTFFAPEGQISAGKEFFESILRNLRKAVCEDFDWPSKREDLALSDTVNLVAAIADVIAAYVGTVPPFIIASLLVRKGMDRLCASYL